MTLKNVPLRPPFDTEQRLPNARCSDTIAARSSIVQGQAPRLAKVQNDDFLPLFDVSALRPCSAVRTLPAAVTRMPNDNTTIEQQGILVVIVPVGDQIQHELI